MFDNEATLEFVRLQCGRMLSFHTNNDLLPLFPPDPGLLRQLGSRLNSMIRDYFPNLRLDVRMFEQDRVQYFVIHFNVPCCGFDNSMTVVVYDILAQSIRFPTDNVLFAMILTDVFGNVLFDRPFLPCKIYLLPDMLHWCGVSSLEHRQMKHITLAGFVISVTSKKKIVKHQAENGESAFEFLQSEYVEHYPSLSILQLGFEVAFHDRSIRHYLIGRNYLKGFRCDGKSNVFDCFLATKNNVEFSEC